jgi:hypothetical protein
MPRSKVELFAATRLAGWLAPATVAKAVNVLSLILAAAVRSQLLVVNPCAGLMLPSNRRAGDSILTITRDEFAGKLLPAVPIEHRAIVCMAGGCGLRWGECDGLSWTRSTWTPPRCTFDRSWSSSPAGWTCGRIRRPGPVDERCRCQASSSQRSGLTSGNTSDRPGLRHSQRHPGSPVQLPPAGVGTGGGAVRAPCRPALPRSAAQLRDLAGLRRRADQRGQPAHGP